MASSIVDPIPQIDELPKHSLALLAFSDSQRSTNQDFRALEKLGHTITLVQNIQDAFRLVGLEKFDAAIIDCMFPHNGSLSFLRDLRAQAILFPIVLLATSGRSTEIIDSLNAGANDYLIKPVNIRELEARLRAHVRAQNWMREDTEICRAGDFIVSPKRMRVWHRGYPLELPKTEYRLLDELVRNADAVLSKEELYRRVWEVDYPLPVGLIEVHVHRLRRRLIEQSGKDPIITMRGLGYLVKSHENRA